jgi:tRNA/tmRNA/rRNA uracil-C5-methylase (TrmA/RlmC/RlmD family)
VFVSGGLPGEKVRVEVFKDRSKFANARVLEVLEKSPRRVRDSGDVESNASFSCCDFAYENELKLVLVKDAFALNRIEYSAVFADNAKVETNGVSEHYRNKYRFYFDQEEYGFAFIEPLSSVRVPQQDFILPDERIIEVAQDTLAELERRAVPPKMLDHLNVRIDNAGNYVLKITPTSLATAKVKKTLAEMSSAPNAVLVDVINAREFQYGVDSFWQVNQPMFGRALEYIQPHFKGNVLDLYSGVGAIGLSCFDEACSSLTLVDIDKKNAQYAQNNLENCLKLFKTANIKHLSTNSSRALEYIEAADLVVLDPPRAGIETKVVAKLLEQVPKTICYLSCNPATFARDVKLLLASGHYSVSESHIFNFFPLTAHIECLAILEARG